MKKLLFILTISTIYCTGFAQSVTETYPKIITSNNDSVKMWYGGISLEFKNKISSGYSPGTNANKGMITYAVFGNSVDTVAIQCKSFPYGQRTTVWVDTPKGKMKVIFRYNPVAGYFSSDYIEANRGKVNFEMPEVYELANIIWILGPGKNDTTIYKNGAYYQRVKKHFAPYINHAIFSHLNIPDSLYANKYFDFRENSFTFEYKGEEITNSDKYFYVMGNDWKEFSNLFKTLLPEIKDFAMKSDFRKFYKDNASFYAAQSARLEELLPVKDMWSWLEKEFPAIKRQSYKIVFSPLIGGSHSTQNYTVMDLKTMALFNESVMFICGADIYDKDDSYSEKEKIGLLSGIVFTEIDHNYVNQHSKKFSKEINTIFDAKNGWSKGQAFYASPMSVFNEYMTHSIFCLWVSETFDKQTAEKVIDNRVTMNRDRRGFVRFKEFNDEMMRLRVANKELTVSQLYPLILNWCNGVVTVVP